MNSDLDRPAFVVGITGHLDPDGDIPAIKEMLELLFRFLKYGAQTQEAHKFFSRLPFIGHAPGLEHWPGLSNTPIIVLTSLAPGADTIAAQVALQSEFAALNFRVLAPLPFPARFFVHSSSFVKNRANRSNAEREAQNTFKNICRQLRPGACFPVWMAEDLLVSENERFRRAAADCRSKRSANRHRRYQVAGEYIASHCDLLVALWDDGHTSGKAEGTEGIVRAKMRGVTPGLRTAANAFSWADCGPVAHIYMHRRLNPVPADPRKINKVRLLHASDLAKPEFRMMSPNASDPLLQTWQGNLLNPEWLSAYNEWQTKGNLLLCKIASNLDGCNSPVPLDTDGCEAAEEYFDAKVVRQNLKRNSPLLRELVDKHTPEFFSALMPLFTTRERTAQTSRTSLRVHSQRLIAGIIWLVFLFAVCLHLSSHWHPQLAHQQHSIVAHPEAGTEAVISHSQELKTIVHSAKHGHEKIDAAETAGHWVRTICEILALGFAGASLHYFGCHRRSGVEDRDRDYRALAEGLRVQIAWCVAGLGRPAAGNYLQRQCSELVWIRNALSALPLPVERWKQWFDAMDASLRVKLLTRVREQWVQSQAAYFTRESKSRHHELHGWHKLGSILSLGGLFQFLALVLLSLSGGASEAGTLNLWDWVYPVIDLLMAIGVVIVMGVIVQYLWCWKMAYLRKRYEAGTNEKALEAHAKVGQDDWKNLIVSSVRKVTSGKDFPTHGITWKKWRKLLDNTWFEALADLLEISIPTPHQPAFQPARETDRKMTGFFWNHCLVSILLGVFLLLLSIAAGHHFPFLPDGTAMVFITSGICLVGGALLVAWAERNLLSEHAYQYNAMASLFVAADERLNNCLISANAGLANGSLHVEEIISEAQILIYDLGKEALDENAEWLILHRSRPMEPVFAG